jgi:hypothetical protein
MQIADLPISLQDRQTCLLDVMTDCWFFLFFSFFLKIHNICFILTKKSFYQNYVHFLPLELIKLLILYTVQNKHSSFIEDSCIFYKYTRQIQFNYIHVFKSLVAKRSRTIYISRWFLVWSIFRYKHVCLRTCMLLSSPYFFLPDNGQRQMFCWLPINWNLILRTWNNSLWLQQWLLPIWMKLVELLMHFFII